MVCRVLWFAVVAGLALVASSLPAVEPSTKAPAPPESPITVAPVVPVAPMSASPAVNVNVTPKTDADLVARVDALEKRIADLERSNKALTDIVNNQSIMLHDAVSGHDSAGGGKYYVPNVQAIRDDRNSRQALVDMVAQGMTQKTGKLTIYNKMDSGQSLVVNGIDSYYIQAHDQRTIVVPSGTATTQLAGEGVKSWMIGAPNYSQDIIIAPAAPTSAATGSVWFDSATGVYWRAP